MSFVSTKAVNITETVNVCTQNIDQLSSIEILRLINDEDRKVALAVQKELSKIALAVDSIVNALRNGGRLIYCGCGTSGRLGVLDASECEVTFGISADLVLGVIAGGDTALRKTMENVEDSEINGQTDLMKLNLNCNDVVVGIAASGATPYVLGALQYANCMHCCTIALCCNTQSALSRIATICIEVLVGPEVLTGSTRMKAGTAQKMVLNMLSTGSMIAMGHCYRNQLIGMNAGACAKLKQRAVRIMCHLTDCTEEQARNRLVESQYNLKAAIIMQTMSTSLDKAHELLHMHSHNLRSCLQTAHNTTNNDKLTKF